MLSEGNLGKIDQVEELLHPEISKVTSTVFSGNLKPFNELKTQVAKDLKIRRNFPPFNFN
jgi:hypothetical protein